MSRIDAKSVKDQAVRDVEAFFDDMEAEGFYDKSVKDWHREQLKRLKTNWSDDELQIIYKAQQMRSSIINGEDDILLKHLNTKCGSDGFARSLLDFYPKLRGHILRRSPIFTYLELISNSMLHHHFSVIAEAGEGCDIYFSDDYSADQIKAAFDHLHSGLSEALSTTMSGKIADHGKKIGDLNEQTNRLEERANITDTTIDEIIEDRLQHLKNANPELDRRAQINEGKELCRAGLSPHIAARTVLDDPKWENRGFNNFIDDEPEYENPIDALRHRL